MKNVFLCFTLDKQSIIVNVSSSYLRPGSVKGATFLPELPSWWTKHSYSSVYWDVWTRISSEESLGKIHVWFDGNINVHRYLAFLELHDLGAGRGRGWRRVGYGCDKAVSYTPPPPSPHNQRWENGAFLAFARLHPWFGGGGLGFAVQFYFVQEISTCLNLCWPLKYGILKQTAKYG